MSGTRSDASRNANCYTRAFSLGFAMLLFSGCNGPTDATISETTGSISITVSTTGQTIDLDSDGYFLELDGGSGNPIGPAGVLSLKNVGKGPHMLRLKGVADNCLLNGPAELSLDVVAGEETTATFSVSCAPNTGNVQLSITTLGSPAPSEPYLVSLTTGTFQPVQIQPNVLTTLKNVRVGRWGLNLSGLGANCVSDEPLPRMIDVTFGQTVQVNLVVNCTETGNIEIAVIASGVDLSPYAYSLEVHPDLPGASSYFLTFGPEKTGALRRPPGIYLLTLHHFTANCDLIDSEEHWVDVKLAATTSVTLGLKCVASAPIAVVVGEGASADIYLASVVGKVSSRLTNQPGFDGEPSWSPDGSRIAFTTERDGNREIYTMRADGTDARRLTNAVDADYSPAWSPDGTRIAFVSKRDGNPEIYSMSPDGSNQTRITNSVAIDDDPAWSPDGAKLVFRQRNGAQNGRILIMNADGSNQRELTSTPLDDGQPAWSPDGSRIAFSRSGEIFVINADGTGLIQLTTDLINGRDPTWYRDSRKIAVGSIETTCFGFYADFYPCEPYIRIIGIDGQVYPFETGLYPSNPAWRP